MDSDEEDFVFVGTPIQREEEITNRRKKAAAEASGNLRALPPWEQEVRDEEGRRRFHGAFTGGFSAGYFNTVGTKEGWAPQSFTSSRKNRAEVKQQSILNFLDEDEKAELEGALGTSSQFDTFGFTAAEYARKQADKEQKQKPSAIPGPVPDELVLPASESIGVKLLLKMGWRHGRTINDSRGSSLYDARREARKAFLAFASEDVKVPNPADEPVEEPESFTHRRAMSIKDSLFGSKSGKAAPGFGIGALEEYDAEDEDIYAAGYDFEQTCMEEDEEPSSLSIESKQPSRLTIESKQKVVARDEGVLHGFKFASVSVCQLESAGGVDIVVFDPPVIPKDFVPHHKFPGPLETLKKLDVPAPPEEVKDIHAEDLATKKMYPKREEFQWRPSPVLCKRFDLIDPFMGKPPPAPRMRSKIDSLLFIPDSVKGAKPEEDTATNREVPAAQTGAQMTIEDVAEKEIEIRTQTPKKWDPEKKTEVATTALNRLIAGDFLESLGKELGFKVPLDMPYSTNKVNAPRIETPNSDSGNPKLSTGTFLNPGNKTAQDSELPKKIRSFQRIRNSNHPPAVREIGAAVPHQKMKGVENIQNEIVIEAATHIAIHPVMIMNTTVLGQKEKGKDHPRERVVPAENTQNIINTEAGTLPAGPIVVRRGNIQKPGKRKENGEIKPL
ncbi:G patch domain-containing protein TGH-like protein [Hibiscus syriacus]|uniref:G patch domain-containing protein TGH-like protein n=1 Tax=Hibiscus syriacus TaxID=106335 RepID=A0A6A2ZU25_HIBSY|nr:G patch domain-containing protein TGH-like protein [Hibiscus syriacus]